MEDGHVKKIRQMEMESGRECDEKLRRQREKMESERDESVGAEIDIARAKLREQDAKHEEEVRNMFLFHYYSINFFFVLLIINILFLNYQPFDTFFLVSCFDFHFPYSTSFTLLVNK